MDQSFWIAPMNKTRKITSADQCTCSNLRKASRATTQMFDSYLHPAGIRVTQFSLLALLSRSDAVPIGEMAERLAMDRTTLTRNLRPLEKEGLLRITPGEDRRIRLVSLTEDGARIFKQALPLWRRAQKDIVRRLGTERWSELLTILSETTEAAHAA